MIDKLVSVVVPVYNVEKYLEECVYSIINQSYTFIEIILIDDGSTDNSCKMCDTFQHIDNRIKVIHKENGGLSSARNAGMKAASGDYLYFLDSDDYIRRDALKQLVYAAEKDNLDVIFFDAETFCDDVLEKKVNFNQYKKKNRYTECDGVEMLLRLLSNNEFSPAVPLFFYRTDYIKDNNIYFREGIIHEDELFSYYVFMANGKIGQSPEVFYYRRVRSGSIITATSSERRFKNTLDVYKEIYFTEYIEKYKNDTKERYLSRLAFSVIRRFEQVREKNNKSSLQKDYRKFLKSVRKKKYYHSLGLKLKCSNKLMKKFYTLQYNLKVLLRNHMKVGNYD